MASGLDFLPFCDPGPRDEVTLCTKEISHLGSIDNFLIIDNNFPEKTDSLYQWLGRKRGASIKKNQAHRSCRIGLPSEVCQLATGRLPEIFNRNNNLRLTALFQFLENLVLVKHRC